jgi:hypothetical protein
MSVIHRKYSLSEVTRIMGLPEKPNSSSHKEENSGWAGGTYQDAVRGSVYGDREISAQVDELARDMFPWSATSSQGIGTEFVFDVAGDYLDIARYLSGEPEHFVTQAESESAPILKIAFNVTAMSNNHADAMQKRAVKLFALVRALELRGYSVELTAYQAIRDVSGQENRMITEITLKRAGDVLDPTIAAFYCCSPLVQRRIIFVLQEQESEETRRNFGFGDYGFFNSGYGRPDSTFEAKKELQADIDVPAIDVCRTMDPMKLAKDNAI